MNGKGPSSQSALRCRLYIPRRAMIRSRDPLEALVPAETSTPTWALASTRTTLPLSGGADKVDHFGIQRLSWESRIL